MQYIYSENDLDIISWERIDQYIDKIYNEVNSFLEVNEFKVKYIIPILRGGGVPSIILSHKLDAIDFLPVQLKYNEDINHQEEKITLDIYSDVKLGNNECILLVEGNHVSGRTANTVKDMIKRKFGENAKIIYISITKDYYYKDSVQGTVFTTCGFYTNERKMLSKEECKELGIDYRKVSVYPWENVKEELNKSK